MSGPFDIVIVAQRGRLAAEAVLFAASLRAADPGFSGRLIVAEPQPGPLWSFNPRIDNDDARAALARLDAEIVPFENRIFGESYPNANKAEALAALSDTGPFVFFDTDTLVTGPVSEIPFDFDRPAASMNREGTWPVIELYGPGYAETWGAVYARFGLDITQTTDPDWPVEHWRHYMYFNAGWFFGLDASDFGTRLNTIMTSIRDETPPELVCQPLYPWLDQISLPLVIHALGGGRPGPELAPLDGSATTHWRVLPLLYARAPDRVIAHLEQVTAPNWIKKALKAHDPFRKMIYQGRGARVRELFDRDNLPRREQAIRNRIKSAKMWMR